MRLKFFPLTISILLSSQALFAAKAIDLRHTSSSYISAFFSIQSTSSPINFKTIRTSKDSNQTIHTHIQQTYAGYPVWNATAIIHNHKATSSNLKNATTRLNGVIYEGLEKDLAKIPNDIFSKEQKYKALQHVKEKFQNKNIKDETAEINIFVDDNQLAHYVYVISFYFEGSESDRPHRPTFIVDANTLQIYREWDQVTSLHDETSLAGGVGGNEKKGPLFYDNTSDHLSALKMKISNTGKTQICEFQNNDFSVINFLNESKVITTPCSKFSSRHNNVAWISLDDNEMRWKTDEKNGGFSPSLDAFYGASVVTKLFQDWYGIFPFVEADGKTPIKIILRVHWRPIDDAFWDGKQITLGDGNKFFYPLTNTGSIAHEIGHGFTQFHSNLDRSNRVMAALHEAFSDMTNAATQFYLTGRNTWEISSEISKNDDAPNRYLDDPRKDGFSIDHTKDYTESTGYYFTMGIFNKAFYLIATSKGWDTHKAYDVMVKANMHYWTSSMKTFSDVACGVISATQDLKYDVNDVRNAFFQVGIDTHNC